MLNVCRYRECVRTVQLVASSEEFELDEDVKIEHERSARKHLRYYSLLRGIKKGDVDTVVNWALNELQLNLYADEIVANYSDGNKRKVSVAIALVSDPPLLLLDEPSAEMDPSAQRFMWDVLLALRKNKRAMVISHSVEECEILCNRVAIMNHGQFRCVGSIQHLKNSQPSSSQAKITRDTDELRKMQETVQIDYSLSQGTLDDMFVSFSNVSADRTDVG
ncbi:unnamed protein product [Litomosoides sigmodontis]|uniref:ABC transporter domain-containing protein n=1 Tax=Litomosoides sigmodontis TaxID=42156 RepID=A0A3P6TR20_LITSI|nr:unnamed protein product [Litomosoides sigmodontis]